MFSRAKFWLLAIVLGTLPLLALAVLQRPIAAAGPWYVAPGGNDANDCLSSGTPCATIQAALGKASPGDTINVATGTYTASGVSDVVAIAQNVTLLGGWNSGFTTEAGLSTVDGQGARRPMSIAGGVNVSVDRFAIKNGLGTGIWNDGYLTLAHSQVIHNSSSQGGGIRSGGNLTITESLIGYNTSTYDGGGITEVGRIIVISSTIVGNQAGSACCNGDGGGGIEVYNGVMTATNSAIIGNILLGGFAGAGIMAGGPVTLINSTVSGNHGGRGEGLVSGPLALFNTTVSANSGVGINGTGTIKNSIVAGNGAGDCTGAMNSLGYNLVQNNLSCSLTGTDLTGLDAKLGPVQDNGGPVQTQALTLGSPAINAANPGGCSGPNGPLASDSRGAPRLGRCDMGAYEAQPVEFADKLVNKATTQPGQSLAYQIHLGDGGSSPISGVLLTDTLPAGLTLQNGSLTASEGSVLYASGVITWTGNLTTSHPITIQFTVSTQANAPIGTIITNTAVINGGGEVFKRSAVTTLALAKLYLPLAVRLDLPPGIQGHVTINGSPASGIFLELRHYNGTSYSTQLSGYTDSNGFYDFNGAPSLPPGQFYYVRFLNPGVNATLLSYWATKRITSYTPGGIYLAGDFDLADITMLSPAPGATVALPFPFQWSLRPATPSDSYQLSLFDPNSNLFAQTVPLGYVSGVNLTGLPGGFHPGPTYGWYLAVNTPDGGYGESFYYRTVKFSNGLAGSQPSVSGGVVLSTVTPPADRPPR